MAHRTPRTVRPQPYDQRTQLTPELAGLAPSAAAEIALDWTRGDEADAGALSADACRRRARSAASLIVAGLGGKPSG